MFSGFLLVMFEKKRSSLVIAERLREEFYKKVGREEISCNVLIYLFAIGVVSFEEFGEYAMMARTGDKILERIFCYCYIFYFVFFRIFLYFLLFIIKIKK